MKIVNFNLQLFAMDPGIEELDEDTAARVGSLQEDYELSDILDAFKFANTTDANRAATALERIADALECIAKHMEPGNA